MFSVKQRDPGQSTMLYEHEHEHEHVGWERTPSGWDLVLAGVSWWCIFHSFGLSQICTTVQIPHLMWDDNLYSFRISYLGSPQNAESRLPFDSRFHTPCQVYPFLLAGPHSFPCKSSSRMRRIPVTCKGCILLRLAQDSSANSYIIPAHSITKYTL